MDTAVQQLQSAVDALREVFEWPGIVIFAKKIQEVFFFGDAWAAQKNKVSAEGQRLAHASVNFCVNLSIFHHIKHHTFESSYIILVGDITILFESYLLEFFWNCQRVGRFVL